MGWQQWSEQHVQSCFEYDLQHTGPSLSTSGGIWFRGAIWFPVATVVSISFGSLNKYRPQYLFLFPFGILKMKQIFYTVMPIDFYSYCQ